MLLSKVGSKINQLSLRFFSSSLLRGLTSLVPKLPYILPYLEGSMRYPNAAADVFNSSYGFCVAQSVGNFPFV